MRGQFLAQASGVGIEAVAHMDFAIYTVYYNLYSTDTDYRGDVFADFAQTVEGLSLEPARALAQRGMY